MKRKDVKAGAVFSIADAISKNGPYLVLSGTNGDVRLWWKTLTPNGSSGWHASDDMLERMTAVSHTPETLTRWVRWLAEHPEEVDV